MDHLRKKVWPFMPNLILFLYFTNKNIHLFYIFSLCISLTHITHFCSRTIGNMAQSIIYTEKYNRRKVSPWPSAEAPQQQNVGHSRNTGVLPAKDRMDISTTCTGDPSANTHWDGKAVAPLFLNCFKTFISLGSVHQLQGSFVGFPTLSNSSSGSVL